MRALIFILLCQWLSTANAAPACYPSFGAVAHVHGVVTIAGQTGRWNSWWCPDGWGDYGPAPERVVWRTGYAIKHPTTKAASTKEEMDAYWKLNTVDCETTADALIYDLCAKAKVAGWDSRPLPLAVVRPNGSYTTRPTYPLINGKRSTVSNGSVPILDQYGRSTPCNPAESVTEGKSTYMQVKRTPGTVALCSATN